MSFTVPTAFAGAEQEYRRQRIKAEYSAHGSGAARQGLTRTQRRNWLAALFKPRRRPNPAPRRPMPAPHHLTSRF